MCPKGDDPFTTYADFHTFTITTTAQSGVLSGQFQFIFNGEYFYFPANASLFDSTACQTALEALPNIEKVICTRGMINSKYGTQYTVQIQEYPILPYENNIYYHEGHPSLNSYQCKTDRVTTGTHPTCTIGIVATGSIPGESSILFV